MKKLYPGNLDKTADAEQTAPVLPSNSVTGTDAASNKIRRRPVPPPSWPKIPEGAAGTAAAFGAWKAVTHSGRKI